MNAEDQNNTQERYEKLPVGIKELIGDDLVPYLDQTNTMHCDLGSAEGWSKFTGIGHIFEIFDHTDVGELLGRIAKREDDREALKAVGADDSAFLPATKGSDAPAGLPEALYYKIDGIEGEMRIAKIGDLAPHTPLLAIREKGSMKKDSSTYTPCSIYALVDDEFVPEKTSFATMIIGREAGSDEDRIWTIFPGKPSTPPALQKDLSGLAHVQGPDDMPANGSGFRPEAYLSTRLRSQLTRNDFVKVIAGREAIQEFFKKYNVEVSAGGGSGSLTSMPEETSVQKLLKLELLKRAPRIQTGKMYNMGEPFEAINTAAEQNKALSSMIKKLEDDMARENE